MRLLLLGCTGFVGKELVPTLLNENHEIYKRFDTFYIIFSIDKN